MVPNDDGLNTVTKGYDKSTEETTESKLVRRLAGELAGEIAKYEIPRAIHLTEGGIWTPETGLVTATMKVKRPAVMEKFRREINAMFDRIN